MKASPQLLGDVSDRKVPWPHATLHQLSDSGTYFVTAGTYRKLHHFRTALRLQVLHRGLLTVCRDFSCGLKHVQSFLITTTTSLHIHQTGNKMPPVSPAFCVNSTRRQQDG